jgi:hypothetical protein
MQCLLRYYTRYFNKKWQSNIWDLHGGDYDEYPLLGSIPEGDILEETAKNSVMQYSYVLPKKKYVSYTKSRLIL